MLEFDWLELFIPHVMEKKFQEIRLPNAVNYCLELNCCIKNNLPERILWRIK